MSTQATTVAFQGEPGAFSEEAIRLHFGAEATTLPCHAFEDIFAEVEGGRSNLRRAAGGEFDGGFDQ